jgi:hypothetical protein
MLTTIQLISKPDQNELDSILFVSSRRSKSTRTYCFSRETKPRNAALKECDHETLDV